MNVLEAIKKGQGYKFEQSPKVLHCLMEIIDRKSAIKRRLVENNYITKHPFHSKYDDWEKLEWYSNVEQKLETYKRKLKKELI